MSFLILPRAMHTGKSARGDVVIQRANAITRVVVFHPLPLTHSAHRWSNADIANTQITSVSNIRHPTFGAKIEFERRLDSKIRETYSEVSRGLKGRTGGSRPLQWVLSPFFIPLLGKNVPCAHRALRGIKWLSSSTNVNFQLTEILSHLECFLVSVYRGLDKRYKVQLADILAGYSIFRKRTSSGAY